MEASMHNNRNISLDTLLVCLSLCVPALYFGGFSALQLIITCLVTVSVSEYILMKLICKRNILSEFSFVASALTIALLLPSDAPLYVGAAASLFSVLVAVFPFGSRLNTPFVPSAVGIAFALTAFKNEISYGNDLSSLISEGQVMSLDFFSVTDILSGAHDGAMGATSLLTLFSVGLYLFIRKKERLLPSLGFILSSAVFAFIFPRVSSGRLTSVFLELSAGSLIFAALLLINHPVTSPEKKLHSFIYGAFGGVLTIALRHFSPVLMPEIFSVLIMNALLSAVTGEPVNRKNILRKERSI
jgi:Na+-translocating ferredoxin:NAD+ oxidoreductase RnfD subunit